MRWRARYRGRCGDAAAEFDRWEDAANWLRAMIEVAKPEHGYAKAVTRLAGSQSDQPIQIEAAANAFTLSKCGEPEAQGSLFR